MAIKKPISTSTEPNDDRPEEHESRPLPEGMRNSGNYFPTSIPIDICDRIRQEARAAKYDNSAEERATIAEVDEAIFARARILEEGLIANGQRILDTTDPARKENGQPVGTPLQVAADRLSELHRIRDDLRMGRGNTADLAERYKKVQNAIHNDHALRTRARDAAAFADRLADPLAHFQKIQNMMPLSHWRPLGIRNW